MPAPLTVDLPTCPVCHLVGKLPTNSFAGKGMCVGPSDEPHKKARMVVKTFREVPAVKGRE